MISPQNSEYNRVKHYIWHFEVLLLLKYLMNCMNTSTITITLIKIVQQYWDNFDLKNKKKKIVTEHYTK